MSTYTAQHVWALAAAAQRINGEYLKEDQYPTVDGVTDYKTPSKIANKKLVKQWLREEHDPTTAADIAHGEECRSYFNGFLLRQISGKINDFEATALKLAQKDEFTGRDMYDFAVIACLPSVMVRDRARQELRREQYMSEQLVGNVGDTVTGTVTIVSSHYSQTYDRTLVKARMGESFIDFWSSKELKGELKIRGKIKNMRADKTTQLSHVKVLS